MTSNDISDEIHVSLNITLDTVLGAEVSYDSDGEPSYSGGITLGNLVVERVAQILAKQASALVDRSRIADRINHQIDEVVAAKLSELMEREIVPTNPYGEAKGQPHTLTEEITQTAIEWLAAKPRNGYGNASTPTNIQKLVAETVDRMFTKELKATIDAAKADVTQRVQQHAAKILADTIVAASAPVLPKL